MKKEVTTKGIIDNLQQKDKKGKNKMGNLEEAIYESVKALIEEHEDEYHDCISVKNMIFDMMGEHNEEEHGDLLYNEEEHGDFLYTKEEIDEKLESTEKYVDKELINHEANSHDDFNFWVRVDKIIKANNEHYYTKEEIDEKFQAVYDFIKGKEETTKKTRVGNRWTENEDFELKYSLKEALNGFANVHKRSVLAIIKRIVDRDLLLIIEKEG